MRPVVPLLAILLFAVGCEAGKLYRQGKSLEGAGQDIKAAESYLDALDARPDQKRAHEALARMGEGAWNKLLKSAEEHEQAGRFPEALAAYQRLATLTTRLDEHELLTFKTINVGERVEAMANASAEERYRAAEAGLKAGRWASAVKEYTAALGFKADYKDSVSKLAAAYYGWGAENLTRAEYREGAGHFVSAQATVPGYKDAAARAAVVYAALGRWFKDQGQCRQAVRDLRQAQALVADPAVGKDLDRAVACATGRVGVAVFGNPTGVSPGGLAVGDLLSDSLIAALPRGASEFLKVEPLAGRGASLDWPGPVYKVTGKLLQVKIVGPDPVAERKEAEIEQRVTCAPGQGEPGALCVVPAAITYLEVHARPSVSLTASFTLAEARRDTVLLADKVSATAGDDVAWAEGVAAVGRPLPIAARDTDLGLILPSWLVEQLSAPKAVRAPDALAADALGRLSGDLAGRIRPLVDAEPPVQDPSALTLPAPGPTR